MADLNKHNKENFTGSIRRRIVEEEQKLGDDNYKQGVKSKPKIISNKFPAAFNDPQIKYKSKVNEQYIKQIKDSSKIEESRKSKQNTLDLLLISIENQKKMN
jgi:hypothetical protein